MKFRVVPVPEQVDPLVIPVSLSHAEAMCTANERRPQAGAVPACSATACTEMHDCFQLEEVRNAPASYLGYEARRCPLSVSASLRPAASSFVRLSRARELPLPLRPNLWHASPTHPVDKIR